jgi:prepilin-type N-terminal cleavage/methylation domain-containing protein
MKEKGFTMIEMLVVIAILGIVTAIAVPNYLKAQRTARESSALKYVRSWSSGQEMYKKANGCYATTDEDLVTGGFVLKAYDSVDGADDPAYSYSIDSNGCAQANPTRWWGRARRKSVTLAAYSYYIDETGTIRRAEAGTANATDPPL